MVDREFIKDYFTEPQDYREFVEDYEVEGKRAKGMDRREFLKKTKTGITGAVALSALSAVQAAFAEKLQEMPLESDDQVDFFALRSEYLLAPHIKYFNHGSIGTIPAMVYEAYRKYLALCETNPWLYMWSDPWEEARVKTREKVANFVGCGDDELVFTHNTTEGFNLLANGLPLKQGDEVVFTSLNHSGASTCWEHYAARHGFAVRRVDFPRNETPDLTVADIVAIYEKSLSEKTRVLVLPHIDNVVGIRHPVKEIATMAREKGVQYVAVDGAQAIGMIPVNLSELGVDFYATSTHKWLQTPKGTGLLYMRKEVQSQVSPMWVTWGQSRWQGTVRIFEDYGTRNLAAVLTLGNAIDFKNKLRKEAAYHRRQQLWNHFYHAVESHPKIIWRSPKNWNLGSSLYAIEVQGKNSRDLFARLFQVHGFVFRPFSSPGWNTLRVSLDTFNTIDEIDQFIRLLA